MNIFSKKVAMLYLQHFLQMLTFTEESWEASKEWPRGSDSYLHYAYPSVALAVVTALLGTLVRDTGWSGQAFFVAAARAAVCGFATVHLGVFFTKTVASFFHGESPSEDLTAFGVYAMTPVFAVNLILPFMPGFVFVKFLCLGCIYSAYLGVQQLQFRSNAPYAGITIGILLSVTPLVVAFLINMLIPNLQL